MKYGIGLIQDLLKTETSPGNDLGELLSLSVVIAIKAQSNGLSDQMRQQFAPIFRDIADEIKVGNDVDKSLLSVFSRRAKKVKNKTGEDNV